MIHKIFMILVLLATSSCMKIKKKGEADESIKPTTKVQQFFGSVSIEEVTYEYGHNGELVFRFPSHWPENIRIEIGSLRKTQQLNIKQQAFWKETTQPIQRTSYRFYNTNENAQVLLDEVFVLPPISLEVSGAINLPKKLELTKKVKSLYFKDLVINNDSELILESFTGKIFIENFESKNGTIRGYPKDSKSEFNQSGRSGGVVVVEIKSGAGHVSFISQGESGADGKNGAEPDASLRGKDGQRGTASTFKSSTLSSRGGLSSIEAWTTLRCQTAPGYGTSGTDGLAGYAGSHGQNGGASGLFLVNNFSDQLNISLHAIAGTGGRAGLGGAGGQGGKAGQNGDGYIQDLAYEYAKKGRMCKINSKNECVTGRSHFHIVAERCVLPVGVHPADGKTGPMGKDGLPGHAGPTQKSCLYKNGQLVRCTY